MQYILQIDTEQERDRETRSGEVLIVYSPESTELIGIYDRLILF